MIAIFLFLQALAGPPMDHPVRFQAHRGGVGEYPENTMAAYQASWGFGALPEIDIRTSKDGAIICLHDASLARTTDAPAEIKDTGVSALTYQEIGKWDAGKRFSSQFAGEKVPLLEDVLRAMKEHPEREIYLDFKQVDLGALAAMIEEYDVAKQIIFCHNRQQTCAEMRARIPGLRTMLWIGGEPEEIQTKFAAAADTGFKDLDQVQLHLNVRKTDGAIEYELPDTFLKRAIAQTRTHGVDLEVLPFQFDDPSLFTLLNLGIRWFATDHPGRFSEAVARWSSTAPALHK